MAITTAMCNSFKQELLGGVHDLDTDTIKIALIKESPSGTYGAATTNYSNVTVNTDEVVGTNYVTGGNTLGSAVIALDGSTATVDFADTTWASATISADGCIIYNYTQSNAAIAVIDFGGPRTSTNGDFTIQLPTADASNAIVRIA
jgi:hypothetical protein